MGWASCWRTAPARSVTVRRRSGGDGDAELGGVEAVGVLGDADGGGAGGGEDGPGGVFWEGAGVGGADAEDVVAESGDLEGGGAGGEGGSVGEGGGGLRDCGEGEAGEQEEGGERFGHEHLVWQFRSVLTVKRDSRSLHCASSDKEFPRRRVGSALACTP